MMYPETIKIYNNEKLEGLAEIYPDIVYSLALPQGLKMSIISPQKKENTVRKYPCMVFIQGSAWQFPNIYYQIPQLSRLAASGYVVAMVTHRNAVDEHPFPGCLQDVKTAIRFLNANADKYSIEENRIGIFGSSSGGNLSLLVGLTVNDEKYETKEYAGFSDKVKLVIDCFGPSNVLKLEERFPGHPVFWGLSGGKIEENKNLLIDMSPIFSVKENMDYPPFLIAHGNKDELVPYEQSVELYQRLSGVGADVKMIEVLDAPHEGSFWSLELFDMIFNFIKEKL